MTTVYFRRVSRLFEFLCSLEDRGKKFEGPINWQIHDVNGLEFFETEDLGAVSKIERSGWRVLLSPGVSFAVYEKGSFVFVGENGTKTIVSIGSVERVEA